MRVGFGLPVWAGSGIRVVEEARGARGARGDTEPAAFGGGAGGALKAVLVCVG